MTAHELQKSRRDGVRRTRLNRVSVAHPSNSNYAERIGIRGTQSPEAPAMFATQTARQTDPVDRRSTQAISVTIRIGTRALLIAILWLAAAPALAAPIPLVEFTYEKQPKFGGDFPPPVRDWEFQFSASLAPDGVPALFVWLGFYGMDDVGKTFPAPAHVVTGAGQALASESTNYTMFTAGFSNPGGPSRLIDMISSNPCNPCARIRVPDPMAYRVTAVERVIDSLIVENLGPNWVVGGKQTIRFLGELVPEPHTVAVLVIGFGLWPYAPVRIRRASDRFSGSVGESSVAPLCYCHCDTSAFEDRRRT
jgi:hypothetical protein